MNGNFSHHSGFYQLLISLEEGKGREGKGENEVTYVCGSVARWQGWDHLRWAWASLPRIRPPHHSGGHSQGTDSSDIMSPALMSLGSAIGRP